MAVPPPRSSPAGAGRGEKGGAGALLSSMSLDPEVDSMRHPVRLVGSFAWRRLLVAVCVLGAVAVAVAGCGGGGSAAAPDTPPAHAVHRAPLRGGQRQRRRPQWTRSRRSPSASRATRSSSRTSRASWPARHRLHARHQAAARRAGRPRARVVRRRRRRDRVRPARQRQGGRRHGAHPARRLAGRHPDPKQHDGVDYYQVDDMLFAVKDGVA